MDMVRYAQLHRSAMCSDDWGVQWQTTWDRSKLFTTRKSRRHQFHLAFGQRQRRHRRERWKYFPVGLGLWRVAELVSFASDSRNPDNYWKLLNYLFVPTDAANAAGLSYIRIPIGASDFSASQYSLDDTNAIHHSIVSTLTARLRTSSLFSKIFSHSTRSRGSTLCRGLRRAEHLVAWLDEEYWHNVGRSLNSNVVNSYATYLRKAVQGFKNKGYLYMPSRSRYNALPCSCFGLIKLASPQNEPLNSNPTYPTCTMTAAIEAQIGNPKLPGTSSCGGPGCRAIVTVNSDGSYSVNQECMFFRYHETQTQLQHGRPEYVLSSLCHGSSLQSDSSTGLRRTLGKRVGVSVGGSLGSGLRVSAFVTGRANPNDWERYSLVGMTTPAAAVGTLFP
ncbi:glycoside hydrolase family protein [Salix suchowensis]|nr:glycoside hydrolase family protein [Salix suchowensis]